MEKLDKVSLKINDKMEHGDLIELIDSKIDRYILEDGTAAIYSREQKEFIDHILITDEYFYNNWITQFAIGMVGDKNYFNFNEWGKLTNLHTKGVIVVHAETKQFLFSIPKLIEPSFSPVIKEKIEKVAGLAAQAKMQSTEKQQESIKGFAKVFSMLAQADEKRDGVTDLIPPHIYEMFKINPKVLKDMIYIRDNFGTISPTDDKWNIVENIIKKNYDGKPVTNKEKELIWSLTENRYKFADGSIVKEKGEMGIEVLLEINDIDPFED